MSWWSPEFSTIYVEHAAAEHAATRRILAKFSGATVIPMEDYRDVFNRPRQRFGHQAQSKALILAVKKDDYLYAGSDNAQIFETRHFYYSTPVLNCIYHCDYCFLQGMYGTANLVAFVNQGDLMAAAAARAAAVGTPENPVFVAISYNTDLLAMEGWLGFCREWIERARLTPGLEIEIRTKSGNFRALRDCPPTERAILAWTVSPPEVFRRYEPGTAPPTVRLRAARAAMEAGWRVRLCLDPVLKFPGWREAYGGFLDSLFNDIPAEKLLDFSTGVFRMNAKYFKAIRRGRPPSDLFYEDFENRDQLVKYRDEDQRMLMDFVAEKLHRHLPPEKTGIWER